MRRKVILGNLGSAAAVILGNLASAVAVILGNLGPGRNAECGMRNAECNESRISHACRVARTPGLPLITHTRKV